MDKQIKLRMTGRQHSFLYDHLFQTTDQEIFALALCGVGQWVEESIRQVVCINQIIPIKNGATLTELAHFPGESFLGILDEAGRKHQTILMIRSALDGDNSFTILDDNRDREIFKYINKSIDTEFVSISATMFPDGRILARTVNEDGTFSNVESTAIAGSDIHIWHSASTSGNIHDSLIKTAQVFGQGTTSLLSNLSIGVVGVSGTGSPVVEMLYRLGVGELVLVDADTVKEKNVGRIYNSTMIDAAKDRYKVNVLEDAIQRSGLPTNVIPIPNDLFHADVVRRLAQCDIVFGCMDSVDGRDLLNRLSCFYLIPYFDLGVHLDADGNGGVNQVCGTVHYLQPDGSSLFSRGVYTEADLRASSLFRTDKEKYNEQVRSKYIRGIDEEKPAVISVNTLIASLGVNDFLARLHPFREDPNTEFESIGISLTQNRLIFGEKSPPCAILNKYVGRGDIKPLLDMPSLSKRRD